MELNLTEFIADTAIWVGALTGPFFLIDQYAKNDEIAKALTDRDWGEALRSLPEKMSGQYDRWFTSRHWSWKCYRRVVVVSCFGVLLFFIYFGSIFVYEWLRDSPKFQNADFTAPDPLTILVVPPLLLVNTWVDFLALGSSRACLRFSASATFERVWYIKHFLVGALASWLVLMIAGVGWFGGMTSLYLLGEWYGPPFEDLVTIEVTESGTIQLNSTSWAVAPAMAPMLMTTIVSFLWMVTLYAAFISSRLIQTVSAGLWGLVARAVDPEKSPLAVMGICLGIVILALRAIGLLVDFIS